MGDHEPTHALIKQDANHPSTSTTRDLTSNKPLRYYLNTHLTDEEILTGDTKLLIQERLLQVSATHTAEEIASSVNTGPSRSLQALTPKLVYHRIHTACHSVANRNNTSFDMVKRALNNARIESGVKSRINASLGRAVSMEAPPQDPPTTSHTKPGLIESDTFLTDIEDDATNYLGDFFSTPSTLRSANPLFKRMPKGGSKLPENEDLIRLAAQHTVMEIVEMIQNADAGTTITNTKISARIMDALSMFSVARELPREVVKREFEFAKQANGVVARHYEKISKKRKASTLAKSKDKGSSYSGVRLKSPKSLSKRKRGSYFLEEEKEEEDKEDQLLPLLRTPGNRGLATPASERDSDKDSLMSDSDDATVSWINSPSYAKSKLVAATPDSDTYSESSEMEEKVPRQCLSRDEAAMILLEMRWLGEQDLSDEGAGLVLLRMKAEAQDVMMGMPNDLYD